MPSGRDGRRPGGQPTRARPQTPWCPSGWGEEGRLAPGAPGESARGRKEGCVHKERRRRVESGLQAEGSWGGVPTKRSQRQPGGRREDRDGGAVIKGETTCKPGRIIAAPPPRRASAGQPAPHTAQTRRGTATSPWTPSGGSATRSACKTVSHPRAKPVDATATAVGESVILEPPASHAPLSGTGWLLSHWFQHVPEACTLFAWEIPKDTSTRV